MTLYVDDMRMSAQVGTLSATWSHLMSDAPSSEELITFALRLGLRPDWIQHPGTHMEHFDLTEPKRALALRLGARAITYGREGYALMQAKQRGEPFDLDQHRALHSDPADGPDQPDLF